MDQVLRKDIPVAFLVIFNPHTHHVFLNSPSLLAAARAPTLTVPHLHI